MKLSSASSFVPQTNHFVFILRSIQNFLENVGDYLTDICFLACKHKVKLEASFINAALACEIMEGIASKLYPTMRVQNIALPMVFKAEVMHGLKEMRKKSVFGFN